MATEPDFESDTIQRHDNGQMSETWVTQNPSRRNASLKKDVNDEVTPWLGNGDSTSGSGGNGPAEIQWDGHADYEGLNWWHRPSVSDSEFCNCAEC